MRCFIHPQRNLHEQLIARNNPNNFYYTCMHSFRSNSDKRFLEISSAICVWFIGDNKGLHVEMKYILCYCKKDPCVWFKIIYLAIDVQDGTKWPDIRDEQRLFEMFDMVGNGQKCSDIVLIGPRLSKILKILRVINSACMIICTAWTLPSHAWQSSPYNWCNQLLRLFIPFVQILMLLYMIT